MVITEDKRSERFFRRLLVALGYHKRAFRFRTAPSGTGSAEAWVRKQYPAEVRALRSKSYQKALCLVVVRDGDNVGVGGRKAELDAALVTAGLEDRQPGERIATPVPTWSIESWLLSLLGHEGVDENQGEPGASGTPWKRVFEREHGADERGALTQAVSAWMRDATDGSELSSLADGRVELGRLG